MQMTGFTDGSAEAGQQARNAADGRGGNPDPSARALMARPIRLRHDDRMGKARMKIMVMAGLASVAAACSAPPRQPVPVPQASMVDRTLCRLKAHRAAATTVPWERMDAFTTTNAACAEAARRGDAEKAEE